MPTDREIFEQYSRLEAEKRSIEAGQAKLKPQILEAIEKAGQDIRVKSIGTFSKSERKTWFYSEEVQVAEDSLKELKKEEEKLGTATFKITTVFPVFKPEKVV
jgi:hypothetical protein